MAMLSISMDLCNSTAIKRAILARGAHNDAHIASVYEEYYKRVADFEFHFYSHIHSNARHIRLEDLFVAKTIGDEVWILYEFPDGVAPDAYAYNLCIIDFVEAAIEALLPIRTLEIPAPRESDAYLYLTPPTQLEVELDFRIHVDLLEQCMEMNALRLGAFNERFAQSFALEKLTAEERHTAYFELAERLHMGTSGGFMGTTRLAYRTDYIGFEIDRFFRASKFALPGLVTLGATLVEQLHFPGTHAAWHAGQAFHIPRGSDRPPVNYRCVSTICSNAQMKGIGAGYRLYHLFDASRLPSGLRRPARDYEDAFNETRVVLHAEGYLT